MEDRRVLLRTRDLYQLLAGAIEVVAHNLTALGHMTSIEARID